MSGVARRAARIAFLAAFAGSLLCSAQARPIATKEGVLPVGTELNEDALDRPTELFYSEQNGGERSYLSKLGDMLFATPGIFGGMARQAGLSCASCHQQGHNNPKLFIPGLSARPGTFATANELFSPHGGGKSEPATPPSLRGARSLAPYTHDGRFATLRDFIRNAVVNEFGGREPSEQIVAALEAYVNDISFLPNEKLGGDGRLNAKSPEAARRGEAIFNRPFPHDQSMSCATCHRPSTAFVDHGLHDVGTGGKFKTPTLLNANFSAPYFHDGRFDSYEQVVDYFDKHFDLRYSSNERADLVAYLNAAGDADEPMTRNTVQAELDEIAMFASVLERAIPERNQEIIQLAVETVGNEWRELGEQFPSPRDPSISVGLRERRHARGAVRDLVLALRRVAMAAEAGDFNEARRLYAGYRAQAAAGAGALKAAEAFSLFNPQVREAHFKALDQLTRQAGGGLAQP